MYSVDNAGHKTLECCILIIKFKGKIKSAFFSNEDIEKFKVYFSKKGNIFLGEK